MNKIWNLSPVFPSLDEDISCDAAVIGGGITGVLCAHALALRGLSVVLLEQYTIAHKGSKTARSTAKATVAHNLLYSTLAETVSKEAARKYAAANLAGLRFLRSIAGPQAAQTRDMFLYALHGERRLQREFRILYDSGIPCDYVTSAPLPFSVSGAVRLPDQLALDPAGLIRDLCSMGHFRVFEQSPVTAFRRSSGRHVLFCRSHTVTAQHIVAATNYPIISSAGMPLKLFRQTSYAVAARCDGGFRMEDVIAFGMDGGYGYRYSPDRECLIVSGETHRGVVNPNAGKRLAQATDEAAIGSAEIVREWSSNDCCTHDGIPYIGALPNGVCIACGYGAWGMTNAASAAVILAEQLCGSGLWYDDLFAPSRNFLRGGAAQFTEHLQVALSGAARTFSTPPDRYASEVMRDHAEIINYHGKRAGVYRAPDGHLYVVSLRCPHLGCSLEWNPEEQTWDCPCHGSRFDYTGTCLSNPAKQGIALT